MQDDPTLNVNLTRALEESKRLADQIKPGSDRWDVIVVGSGAAGGMAAFQLAMAGVKVLLLEAGRMIDVRTEYKTMEWPYASMRRNRLPPGERPVDVAEYSFLDRPYGSNPAFEKHKKVVSYAANRFTRNWVVDERQHPTTGTPYAWVRADVLGGKTNFWGRGALRYGPLQFNAASRDGFDVDWPISYDDVKPYYDKVDVLLGCSGTNEGLDQVPDGVFQRPSKLNCVEVAFKRAIAKMGRHYIPGRAGVTTDGVLNNKYRARCAGRGRCGRGCDIQAAFHSPTALIYPARDSGNMTVRPYSRVSEVLVGEPSNRATGVRVIDANTREVMDFKAPVVVLGAGALDTTRILLNSRSTRASERPREFVGCARLLSERAHHGHPRQRLHPGADRHRGDARRWAPGGAVHPAVSQRHRSASGLHPRLPFPGRRRLRRVPEHGERHRRLREGVQVERAQALSGPHQLRRLWRGPAAQGEPRHARSAREGRVGHPGPAVRLHLPRQRAEDGQGHGRLASRRC